MSVLAVSSSSEHTFSKSNQAVITLIVGHGVQGDCHAGKTVQHRSRLKIQPPPPNLRQVHLIQSEIFEEVRQNELRDDVSRRHDPTKVASFLSSFFSHDSNPGAGSSEPSSSGSSSHPSLLPGQLGENVTTQGIDLLGLSEGTVLRFVDDGDDTEEKKQDVATSVAGIRITGLRNPCPQIEKFRDGLQDRFIVRDEQRKIVGRKAGVMGVVENGGEVKPGMKILVVYDESLGGHKALVCV